MNQRYDHIRKRLTDLGISNSDMDDIEVTFVELLDMVDRYRELATICKDFTDKLIEWVAENG